MKKSVQLLSQAKAKRDQASALSKAEGLTDAQEKQVDGLIIEAKALEQQAEEAQAREKRLEDNEAAREALAAGGPRKTETGDGDGVVARPAFLDDPARGYKSPRQFLLEVRGYHRTGRASEQLRSLMAPDDVRAAAGSDEHSGASDAYGAILIPKSFSPTLKSVGMEGDPTLGRTQIVPMATRVVQLAARVDKNHTTSVSGGLQVYRRSDTQGVTPTRLKLDGIELKAEDLMGVAYATERLLRESAISFAALLEAGFRDEFAARRLKEIISGVGAGELVGVLNAACTIEQAKEGGQANTTIVGKNIRNMRARSWRYSNSVWLANHDTLPELMGAHLTGTNGDVFLFAPGNGVDKPDTLMGRPIFFTEFCKTLGQKGDLILADFSQYLEGEFEPIQGASSMHVRFVEHEQAFKFWMSNCGAPWWNAALTPAESTTTLSPFVVLAKRAA